MKRSLPELYSNLSTIGIAIAEALAEEGADIIGVSVTLKLKGSKIDQAVNNTVRKFLPINVILVNGHHSSPSSPKLRKSVDVRIF